MKKLIALVLAMILVFMFSVAISDEPHSTVLKLTVEGSYVWSVPSSVPMYENPTNDQNKVTIILQEVERYGDKYIVTITADEATLFNEDDNSYSVKVKLNESPLTFEAPGTETGTLSFVNTADAAKAPEGTYKGTMTFTCSIGYQNPTTP